MATLLEILQKSSEFLGGRGIESPRLNAELLIGHVLGLKRMQLYLAFERVLTEPELERLRSLMRRRGKGEPVQYVLGETEFDGLKLAVDQRVLIPRPETEWLVETLATRMGEMPPARVLDLGTGSGALALALAKRFAEARVVAVDVVETALAVARANGEKHAELGARVEWRRSDWYGAIGAEERFELIVANPPYLTEAEWVEAKAEVRDWEPKGALTAADAGCADLEKIIAGAAARLAPGGWLAMETGIAQHGRLLVAVAAAGLREGESLNDLTGRPRFVVARAGS